ncbi:MAG: hypothetical protein EHM72_08585 [Calditrichaeota bacterium]|nr:MAG: hypothetical protein EHM72_08585 [Calditrichota bacterium]
MSVWCAGIALMSFRRLLIPISIGIFIGISSSQSRILFCCLVVDFSQMAGRQVMATWYNPVTGVYRDAGLFSVDRRELITPPENQDWVLWLKSQM